MPGLNDENIHDIKIAMQMPQGSVNLLVFSSSGNILSELRASDCAIPIQYAAILVLVLPAVYN